MKVYRWEWPKEDFFIEAVAWSREEAIRILKEAYQEEGWAFPEKELFSSVYSERKFEGKVPYIDWGRISEAKEKESFEFHHCVKCDLNYEVIGQINETDMDGVWKITSFDQSCPRCQSDGTGVILKFVEDCPTCQYAWEVVVFKERSSYFMEAECECCGCRIRERVHADPTVDGLINKWRYITTHTMIERTEEY